MADVKVCDRCCKVLDTPRGLISFKPVKHHKLQVEVFNKSRYDWEDYRKTNTNHDLCDNCTKKLIEFLEGKSVDAIENT